MFTMWPPSRTCGRQSRVIRIRPFTFVSSTVRSSSSVDCANDSRPSASPAPLTRTSIAPSASTARATKVSQLPGSVTSSSSGTSASIRSTRLAPPATRTPSRRSARTTEAPIPLEAPVTTAVFPASVTATTLGEELLKRRRDLLGRLLGHVVPAVDHDGATHVVGPRAPDLGRVAVLRGVVASRPRDEDGTANPPAAGAVCLVGRMVDAEPGAIVLEHRPYRRRIADRPLPVLPVLAPHRLRPGIGVPRVGIREDRALGLFRHPEEEPVPPRPRERR